MTNTSIRQGVGFLDLEEGLLLPSMLKDCTYTLTVVPYNPFLLTKYEAHLNVEICASI